LPIEPRVSLVTLGVADLARARAFNETGLGWPASPASQGDIVFFALGGVALALFPRAALAADAQVSARGQGFAGVTLAHNVRRREEVEAALAQAVAAGGRLVKPAQVAEWGGFSGYFADPDGHLWEVCWNPFLPLDARGALVLL
jgi:catechol 2,3-dioxygenase-like lactoylglutathione lyase family enzyme